MARQGKSITSQRGSLLIPGIFVVIIAALIVAAFFGVRGAQMSADRKKQAIAAGEAVPPPWQLPADEAKQIEAAGLVPARMEGNAEHYHAHLTVTIDGENVPVPANLGIDATSGQMAPLHTHTSDGTIHIESPNVGETFTLGQLFTEWNVRLTAKQIGSLKAGDRNELVAFVNRKRVDGDPARIGFATRRQIDLVFADADSVKPPSKYTFPKGQ